MSQDLTLFQIDESLLQLLAAKEDIEGMLAAALDNPEAMTAAERQERTAELVEIDRLLVEYRDKEVTKVDGVRAFILHARLMQEAHREEAERQRQLAAMWEQREKLILNMVAAVIQKEPGRKMLEGRAGQLRLKGNGGKRPVVVTNEEMLPEEAVKYTGWIGGATWAAIRKACPWIDDEMAKAPAAVKYSFKREASMSSIAALLEEKCHYCDGLGMVKAKDGDHNGMLPCPAGCKDGGATVPGAYMGARGEHVEVK